jgi:hypothetical protein
MKGFEKGMDDTIDRQFMDRSATTSHCLFSVGALCKAPFRAKWQSTLIC